MQQRKSILLSCLICVLALGAATGVLIVRGRVDGPVSEPATAYDQLLLNISFQDVECQVRLWQSEDGVYYFFLPSGAENNKVFFGNLGDKGILQLDTYVYSGRTSILEGIEYGRRYEMQLSLSTDDQPLAPVPVIFLKSEDIPALFINTETGSLEDIHADKSVKEKANLLLVENDGSKVFSDELEYIKTRGNATFYKDKKTYQIKLSRDYAFLGMLAARKWVLQANAMDDSLIKNDTVFQFTEEYTSVPSIQGRYVDLYVNGDYLGNYYLCEKVEVGENRLNITDLEEKTERINLDSSYQNAVLYVSENGNIKATEGLENPEDITGGYLVEYIGAEKYDACNNAFRTNAGYCYEIISPAPATVEQAEYICDLFNQMEMAIAQDDGIHPETGRHFSEYIDVDSWASKYVIEEVFYNLDSSGASVFFYKDIDSKDYHIFAGPMWDYDRTLGSYGYGKLPLYLDGVQRVGKCGLYVDAMMQHGEVSDLVYEKFSQFFLPYVHYLAKADIYRRSEAIRTSLEMDRIRWPEVYGHYTDIDAARDYMVCFLEKRVAFLEEVWLEGEVYCDVSFLDYYGTTIAQYSVKRGEHLETIPELTTYTSLFNGWYDVKSGAAFDARLPVLENVTYQSQWIDLSVVLINGLNMAELDISDVDPEILRQLADIIEEQQSYAEAGQ